MSSRRGTGGRSRGDVTQSGGGSQALQHHLDAEDPDTNSIEVARIWVRAYDELVEFEERMLARLTEMLPALSGEARHEAELTNLPMIVQHLQTFRYRRAHWRRRAADLDGQ